MSLGNYEMSLFSITVSLCLSLYLSSSLSLYYPFRIHLFPEGRVRGVDIKPMSIDSSEGTIANIRIADINSKRTSTASDIRALSLCRSLGESCQQNVF